MISYKLMSYTHGGDLMMKALINKSKQFLKHISFFPMCRHYKYCIHVADIILMSELGIPVLRIVRKSNRGLLYILN